MILGVQVKPNARVTRVVGWADARTLVLAVAAPPVDGKANEEVIRFLGKTLGLPRSAVTIARGATARTKLVELPDGTPLDVLRENSIPLS